MLQDHLNSSSGFVDQAGNTVTTNYYYPYGGNRGSTAFSGLSTKRFTGQYHESSLPGGEGLSYYNARWYDAQLGRFLSADTIVPGPHNPQAFNRYSYVLNNPVKFVDPSGHDSCTYQEGTNGAAGSIQCNPTPIIGGITLTIDPNANPCKPTCTSLSDILAQTLDSLKDVKVEVSITYDDHGLPVVQFDKNKLIATLATPLQECAMAAGGACGYSFGTSGNAYGGGVRGDVAVYVDQAGTMGVFLEGGGGGYTPLPSPISKLSVIGIPEATIYDLDGLSAQFGGAGALGGVGGAGEAVFLKSDGGVSLRGQAYGYAYTPLPYAGELHLTMTWAQPLIYVPPISRR